MRTETRTKTVEYKVYIASDGQEFTSEDECLGHEKILDGTRKVCPFCNGKGGTYGEYIPERQHWDGPVGGYRPFTKCDKCDGKGYLDKVIVWK